MTWTWALAMAACLSAGAQGAPTASTAASQATPTRLSEAMRRAVMQRLVGAHRLEPQPIAAELLDPVDRDNDVVYRVEGADGRTLGWARPLTGPVSAAGACPCNPLDLTLVFDAARKLVAIESPAPLQKWGHQAMSPQEHQRLVALCDQPPPALAQVQRGEDLLDMETGATKHAFAPAVVSQAGLSTQRIAAWTQQTRAIIDGTPASQQRRAVFNILRGEAQQGARAVDRQLAALIPTMEEAGLQMQVYRYLAGRYLAAQEQGAAPDPRVEATLAQPRLRDPRAADEVALVLYEFADRGLRPGWVRGCVDRVIEAAEGSPFAQALRGTERLAAGDPRAALTPLQLAAGAMAPQNRPTLHLRLAQAALQAGNKQLACGTAEVLYVHAPVLPGLAAVLDRCDLRGGSAQAFQDDLRAQARAAFLRTARPGGAARSAPLSLTDLHGAEQAVPLARPGQVSVVMFFATWCPHCRMELPRVGDFARAVQSDPLLRGRVATLAVRTAVDKETEPFAAFVAQLQAPFPIYSDGPSSAALTQFARQHQLPLALPTLAVLDGAGQMRYLLEPGDWRDTAAELAWAASDLLAAAPEQPHGQASED